MPEPDPVSVVIPVYNGARYLAEAIRSALAQTHSRIEVVVVDDGSTDGSAEVARAFPGVRLLQQPNRGIGPARNAGVEASTGAFLSFLDADDLLRPAKTARQLEVLRERPSADIVFGHACEFFSPELAPENRPAVRISPDPVPARIPTSALMSRATFERVGPFSDQRAGQGVDWFLRARDMGLELIVLDDVVYDRRIHRANQGVAARHLQRDRLDALRASLKRRRRP